MRPALLFAAAFAVIALMSEPSMAQCAMCRTALQSPEAVALAAGFRRAVLFLLAVPFTALGVIAGLVTYRIKRATREQG